MKITFLGTGAADWHKKKMDGFSEFRRYSSALVDDILLIDPGPQVPEALDEWQKDKTKVKYIINTHRHSDHFCVDTIKHLEAFGAKFFDLSDGDTVQIGNYTVRAYAGNHSTSEKTVHFMISDPSRTLFYALDGAWLLYEEVQAIKAHKPNLAVLDATIGDVDGDYRIFEHNNLNMVLEMKKTLNQYIGTFSISHMARTLHTDHKTLSDKMKAYDVVVAYDGLEMEV